MTLHLSQDDRTRAQPRRHLIRFHGALTPNAMYAVGQIEAVFMLAISWLHFRGKIAAPEWMGMVCPVADVLMFKQVCPLT